MKRMFEFMCEEGHISESLTEPEDRQISCRCCGKLAERIISSPSINLEPFSGSFPGAYDAWNKKRAEKLKQEKKKNES